MFAFLGIRFLFSCIKIVAILSMIGFGAYLLLSGSAGPQAGVANLWQHGGFFPHGIHGFIILWLSLCLHSVV